MHAQRHSSLHWNQVGRVLPFRAIIAGEPVRNPVPGVVAHVCGKAPWLCRGISVSGVNVTVARVLDRPAMSTKSVGLRICAKSASSSPDMTRIIYG